MIGSSVYSTFEPTTLRHLPVLDEAALAFNRENRPTWAVMVMVECILGGSDVQSRPLNLTSEILCSNLELLLMQGKSQ
jgi:hypothetical protein